MLNIFIINELSFWPFLLKILQRQNVEILRIEPLLPQSSKWLKRAVHALSNCFWIDFAGSRCREIDLLEQYDQRVHLYNVYDDLEGWQRCYYDFAELDARLPGYAHAVKHASSIYLAHRLTTILEVKKLLSGQPCDPFQIHGMTADVADAAETYLGRPLKDRVKAQRIWNRLCNFLLMIGALGHSLVWGLSKVRLGSRRPLPIFFAADHLGDTDDVTLYREIHSGGRLLYVARNSTYQAQISKEELEWGDAVQVAQGHLSLQSAIAAVFFWLWRDYFRLYALQGGHPVPYFYRLMALPRARLQYRALFQKFRVRFYWGRDQYDSAHIIRHQEIGRIGGQSLAYCTSYLTYGRVYPEFRYLSFDRYYMIGEIQYDEVYRDTWPAGMKIIAASPYRISRDQFRKRLKPRPKDILVAVSVFASEQAMVDFVRDLADEFPDRRIILQLKVNMVINSYEPDFVEKCLVGKSNIEYRTETPYHLFESVSFMVSDPSTMIAEALQCGVYAFLADIFAEQKHCWFRDVDGICVNNAATAARRIRDIESDAWHYPIEHLARYVDLNGLPFHDQIRTDLGLVPVEVAVATWPKHLSETAGAEHMKGAIG